MWNRPVQLLFVSGRTQNAVEKFAAPWSRLSGRSTALAVLPPGRLIALPSTPLVDQPVVPVRTAAPTEPTVPVLATVVPVPSSNSYRMGMPVAGGGGLSPTITRSSIIIPAVAPTAALRVSTCEAVAAVKVPTYVP